MQYRSMFFSIILVVVIVLFLTIPSFSCIIYFVLATYALLGRVQAIQALALSWFFALFNPGLVPSAESVSIGRYAVLGGAALSVLIRGRSFDCDVQVRKMIVLTIFLVSFLFLHSLLFSRIPDVSILKALSWGLTTIILFMAWSGLNVEDAGRVGRWLYGGLVATLLASLPLTVSSVGYLRNETGFQGIFSHPQILGLVMALLSAWTFGLMVERRLAPWGFMVLLMVCFIMVVMSESRTAGLALMAGVPIALLMMGKFVYRAAPGLLSWRFRGFMLFALILAVVVGSKFTERFSDFISKNGRAEVAGLVEAYDQSRGHLIAKMWTNIQAHPFQGIGFGVSSNPLAINVIRDPVFGVPMGASTEKGVAFIAILEEVGLFGFGLVLVWLCMLVRCCAARGIAALSVCLVGLVLNVGEAIMFSAGGSGLLLLILFSWGAAQPSSCNRVRFGGEYVQSRS